jgi:hypothetical protein
MKVAPYALFSNKGVHRELVEKLALLAALSRSSLRGSRSNPATSHLSSEESV